MKTKYILLTAVLLFGFTTAQTQDNDSDFMNGVQSTLNNSFTANPEITNLGRLWLILTSDIRMVMKAPKKEEEFKTGLLRPLPLSYEYDLEYGEGIIKGEFDWENKALSLHIKRREIRDDILVAPFGSFLTTYDWEKIDEIDHYQYMDLDGYWYIPDSPKANLEASTSYIKFHGQTAMMSLTRSMRALASSLASEQFINAINRIGSQLNPNFVNGIINSISGGNPQDFSIDLPELTSQIESLIDGQLSTAFAQPLPLFMHWTLIYSPDYVRQEGNVTETRFTYRDIPNCLKLTAGGGKYMIFDNYNRLVFINSGPKGGSVEYFYDRDLTVNLPAASFVSVGSPFNRNRN